MQYLLLLFFVAAPSFATTLVALWAPDKIVLAADSRVVTDGPGLPAEACKIAHQGSTYFGISGLVEDSASGFAVAPLLRESVSSGATMGDKISRFIETVRPRLTKTLDLLRHQAPADYAYLRQGRPVLQAIFAGHHDGKPVLAIAGFHVTPEGSLAVQSSVVDGSDARGPRLIYAGQQSRIREYLRSHPGWIDGDRHALVRNLVQLEVNAGTALVGGPVDLLELDGRGAHWLQKKSFCAE